VRTDITEKELFDGYDRLRDKWTAISTVDGDQVEWNYVPIKSKDVGLYDISMLMAYAMLTATYQKLDLEEMGVEFSKILICPLGGGDYRSGGCYLVDAMSYDINHPTVNRIRNEVLEVLNAEEVDMAGKLNSPLAEESGTTDQQKNPVTDLLNNIDDDIDLDETEEQDF
jgi:hypothetical protein